MPYISPQPAPSLGWLSQDRCETQTRRQSPEDTRPKVAHAAESLECPPTVVSLTQLLSLFLLKQWVAECVWSECV